MRAAGRRRSQVRVRFAVAFFLDESERPAGAFTERDNDEHGELCSQGTVRQIVEDEQIIYTWAWEDDEGKPGHETLVTITFFDEGEQTRMYFRQGPFESAEDRESHESGWKRPSGPIRMSPRSRRI